LSKHDIVINLNFFMTAPDDPPEHFSVVDGSSGLAAVDLPDMAYDIIAEPSSPVYIPVPLAQDMHGYSVTEAV